PFNLAETPVRTFDPPITPSTNAAVESPFPGLPVDLDKQPGTPSTSVAKPAAVNSASADPDAADFNPFGSIELPKSKPIRSETENSPTTTTNKIPTGISFAEKPDGTLPPLADPVTTTPRIAEFPTTSPVDTLEKPTVEVPFGNLEPLPLQPDPKASRTEPEAGPNPFAFPPKTSDPKIKNAPSKVVEPLDLEQPKSQVEPEPSTFPSLPDAFPPLGTGPSGAIREPSDASDHSNAPPINTPKSVATPVLQPISGDTPPLGGFEFDSTQDPVSKKITVPRTAELESEGLKPTVDESLKGRATIDRKGILHSLKPQLQIEKRAPKTATLGKPLVYDIIVTNNGTVPAEKVVVEDGIPKGSKLDATKPQAELIDGRLVWEIGTIPPGKQRVISVRVIPTSEGSLGSIATVYSVAEVAAVTKITAPKLELTITAPAKAEMGEKVVYEFKIKNTGTSSAENVFIRNKLPAGLSHPSGDDLEYKIDVLPAGASKSVKLTLTATQPGVIVNSADAIADGDLKVVAQAKIDVSGSRLVVERTGPKRRFVGYPAEFKNEVSNRSQETVVNAMLVEKLPLGMEFVEASVGGQYNAVQRTVAWKIDRLDPKQSKAYTVKLVPRAVGTKTSVVQVTEPTGGEAAATSDTKIEDFASLALDISEVLRPVAIGNRVAMRIRARNRGTTQATNVTVVVTVPTAMRVVTAGPGKYEVQGNQVLFTAKETLAGNANADFDLVLEAVTNADVRLKAQVSADQMQTPLSREEAIVIFKP
ncbi:MAG: hypothetical protein O3A00_00920, partial [Planctomycetota bacterium]|nr:hypothetical protein [Planctomycetota bacterium]